MPIPRLPIALTILALTLSTACSGAQTTGGEGGAGFVIDVTPSATPAPTPDIEQFMQILSASSPHRTESGAVYYVTWETGIDQLYRLAPDGGSTERLTDFEDGVSSYAVSPDGAHAIVTTSVGGSEQMDIYHLDTASGIVQPLLVDPAIRYENVFWLPDSRAFLLRSNLANGTDFFIYRYDLAGERLDLIGETPGYNWIVDVSDDGQRVLVTRYQSNADSDVLEVDLLTEGAPAVSHLTPHEGEIQYRGAAYDASGEVIVATDRGADALGLARLVGETGEVEWLVQDRWEIEEFGLSDDRRTLAFVTNEDGFGRVHLLDLATGERLPDPAIPDGIATLAQFEHGHLMFVFTSATRTHDVWELRLEDGRVRQVTFSDYQGIDQSLFREPELVHFASFDGLEIPAFLYLPPNYSGGVVPTIIHVHGGPESQFRPSFARHFQYLMLNGFAILAPNIRGSSGYGPAYMALDDYRRRLDSIRDLGAAADYLAERGIADRAHLGIKGASYGGYAVMAAITEMPGRFAAASNTVGIVNFVSFLENTADYRRALREVEYGPLTDPEFLESVSPIHKVDQIETPLLVIHGENDSRVPVGEARQIIAALEARGQPVEALIFENEGHGVSHLDNRLLMYRAMVDFFSQHLVP